MGFYNNDAIRGKKWDDAKKKRKKYEILFKYQILKIETTIAKWKD